MTAARPLMINGFDISSLEGGRERSFVLYEQAMREKLDESKISDRRDFSDMDGNYYGAYGPERRYTSSILAYIDEFELDLPVLDISDADDKDFIKAFSRFEGKVDYFKNRIALRVHGVDSGILGTPIVISSGYKEEIHQHLEKIRKIVTQSIESEEKRTAILGRIGKLEQEVDRDKTTKDILYGQAVELFGVLGECADKAEPAVRIFERVMTALYKGAESVKLLSDVGRPKLIEQKKVSNDMDDEIPF